MALRFLADEDLHRDIVSGLRFREPAIDLIDAQEQGLRGMKDPQLLELAAEMGRVVISHDRSTMIREFYKRVAGGRASPGLIIIRQRPPIGEIVEWLLMFWAATSAEEWWNRVEFLPYG